MFKNLNNFTQLLKSASSMGERVKEMREALGRETVKGVAAEERIEVQISGLGEVQSLRIDASIVEEGGVAAIEQQLPIALNEALAQVRKMHVDKMREATGGISLPGLDEALANL